MEIPKAPSPAKPTTGTVGLAILAPRMAGKLYPQGPNMPGARYLRPLSKLGYALPIAQLLPMSEDTMASGGRPFSGTCCLGGPCEHARSKWCLDHQPRGPFQPA